MQEHAASLAAELASSKKEQERLRAEAAAAAQDARESLGRETDIQEQLQRADQVINCITRGSSGVVIPNISNTYLNQIRGLFSHRIGCHELCSLCG